MEANTIILYVLAIIALILAIIGLIIGIIALSKSNKVRAGPRGPPGPRGLTGTCNCDTNRSVVVEKPVAQIPIVSTPVPQAYIPPPPPSTPNTNGFSHTMGANSIFDKMADYDDMDGPSYKMDAGSSGMPYQTNAMPPVKTPNAQPMKPVLGNVAARRPASYF